MTDDDKNDLTAFCPACGNRTAKRHCKDVKCGWMKCMTSTCEAVVDPHRKRGYRNADVGDPDRVMVNGVARDVTHMPVALR